MVKSTANEAISGWSAGSNKGSIRDLVDLRDYLGLVRLNEACKSRKERRIRQIPQKNGNSAVNTVPCPTEVAMGYSTKSLVQPLVRQLVTIEQKFRVASGLRAVWKRENRRLALCCPILRAQFCFGRDCREIFETTPAKSSKLELIHF
jgi:hypothetical protein